MGRICIAWEDSGTVPLCKGFGVDRIEGAAMAWLAGLVGLLIGSVVGVLVGWLLADRKSARLAAQLESAQQNLEAQRKLLEEARTQLRDAFASISTEALTRNSETFLTLARERFAALATDAAGSLEQRKAQIEGLIKPLQQLLSTYQQRLSEIEQSRAESYGKLREQLGALAETQRTLHLQTHELVTALRRPQTRGRWGEITLKRLVELAGMSAHCDFDEQSTVTTDDDRQMRPDMIVHLPGGRQIVIDCKAVLDAFLDAASAPDEQTRTACMQRHAAQVRSRAAQLSTKAYWSQFARSPEFVVMFLPGESFLYGAVEHDSSLLEDCFQSAVILATPTTLIALLKVIEFGWRQEAIAENAEAIRKHGKDLYDRIVVLANHFSRLGASIESSVKIYNQLLGSLESRVLVTARKIGEMGVRSDEEVPAPQPIDLQPRELSTATELAPPLNK